MSAIGSGRISRCSSPNSKDRHIEELIETFDKTGRRNGVVARSVAHRMGLWHRAANVLLFRSNGDLVIQRRSDSKDVYPGAWDLSMAEHLLPGEHYLNAAGRGLEEELGLSDVNLRRVGDEIRWQLNLPELSIKDFEFQATYLCVSDAALTPQATEVAELRQVSLRELGDAFANNPVQFTPWFIRCANHVGLFSGHYSCSAMTPFHQETNT